jgi:hypothetical protein
VKTSLKVIIVALVSILAISASGCSRQANRVSYNLSQEADNFNITRKLTVINLRSEENSIIFQMIGNFSLQDEEHNELVVVGEDENGRYYKHFVYLPATEVTYIVEDLDRTSTSKHRYQLNFNPKMLIPIEPVIIE